MRILTALFLLAFAMVPPAAAASALPDFAGKQLLLVQAGRPAATIVIAAEATDLEKQAAAELQTFLERMSGARLPIATDASLVEGNVVSVGHNRVQQQADVSVRRGPYPLPETVRVKVKGSALFLVGNDTAGGYKGTLLAVYTLLRGLGCRWYMPGPLGEVIPRRGTVGVRKVEYAHHSPFVHRTPFWIGYGRRKQIPAAMAAEQRQWMQRNLQGGYAFSFGHNFFNMVPPSLFDQHPEYFALVKGERTRDAQICTSNPAVVERCAQAAIAAFTRTPEAVSYSLSPNDGAGWCECEQCLAVSPDLMDRLLTFFNAVAAKVEPRYPDKLLAFYVYADLTLLPKRVKPHRMILPVIAHYNNADQAHPMTCPLETAKYYRGIIEGWRKLSGKVGIREYFGYGFDEFPKPMAHVHQGSIPYWARNGAILCNAEGGDGWGGNGLSWYVAAQLLWDPGLDADALLADYYQGMFAEAADPMAEYFGALERTFAVAGGPVVLGPYQIPSLFAPVLPRLEQALRRAEAAARQDTVKQRLAFVRASFTYARKYLALRGAHDAFLANPTAEAATAAGAADTDLRQYVAGLGESYVVNPGVFATQIAPALDQMKSSREDLARTTGQYSLVAVLPEMWQFQRDPGNRGEGEKWYAPEYRPKGWQMLSINRFWETQIGVYDGFGWYRLEVNIPPLPAGKRVFLRFGAIDESEWVWVNGRPVGSFVFDMERNPNSWKEPATFDITAAVRPGETNVVAVKVGDKSGLGGIWKGASILSEK